MLIVSWKNLNKPGIDEKFVIFIKGVILALIVQSMFMDFMFLDIKTYYFVFLGLSEKYYRMQDKKKRSIK